MTDNVRRLASKYAPHQRRYSELTRRSFAFAPGKDVERMPRRARRGVLGRGLFLLVVLGTGWVIYKDPSQVARWWSLAVEKTGPLLAHAIEKSNTPARPVDVVERGSSGNIAVATTMPAPVGSIPNTPVVAPGNGQVQENAGSNADTPKPEAPRIIAALAPVRGVVKPPEARQKTAPKRDRLAALALAAGLHPGMSRVLLSRLSRTDFRNARYAVRTALAQTADDATFKWPRRRKPGLAIFDVRFVPGAGNGCRRYVVTVEKDRWLTTALPVEKCGVKRRQASRAVK